MIIQHNIMALNAHRQLGGNNSMVSKNLEKLSSGYRINRAGDDAAGLAISEKMRAQIKGLEVAQTNAQDGISLIQTAEGALTEVHSMLNRMVELAQQSANGTIDDTVDRAAIQAEVDALSSEIDRIANSTNFNGLSLLDGSLATSTPAAPTPSFDFNAVIDDGNNDAGVTQFSIIGGDPEILAAGIEFTFSIEFTQGSPDTAVGTLTTAGLTFTTTEDIDESGISGTINFEAVGTGHPFEGATVRIDYDSFNTSATNTFVSKINVTKEDITPVPTPSSGGLTLQVGDSDEFFQKVTVSVDDMTIAGLGLTAISVSSQSDASASIQIIKGAINTVSASRGNLGALQNRLEHTINNLAVSSENMTAAESRIRDVDMAKEMMEFTKNNVLTQAAQAMLAQANQQPQSILQLLR